MKLYFAGADGTMFIKLLLEMKVKNILTSFFFLNKNFNFKEIKEKGIDIFVDSGGFSARTAGKHVDIQGYKDFLKTHKDNIVTAANLDVNDLAIQLENQKILEEVYPILPVYHLSEYLSENRNILFEYLDKYKYIALGGMIGSDAKEYNIKNFLNFCFKNGKGIKYHGFGITSPDRLKEYPFYSVDSTTWLSGARFGIMHIWDSEKMIFKTNIHYSDNEKVIKNNINIDTLKDTYIRLRHNVVELLKMEKDITRLWEYRGIKFN